MEAAAMQRMNTDVKRRIFLEIMSSEVSEEITSFR